MTNLKEYIKSVVELVNSGEIELPYAAKTIHAGLKYTSVLAPLPFETQLRNGVTMGKMRGYGKVVVRLFRSVGGKYGYSLDSLYDFPFVPSQWGEAVEPFTGDIECILNGGQATDSTLYLVQELPLPWQLVAIMADIDFGEV